MTDSGAVDVGSIPAGATTEGEEYKKNHICSTQIWFFFMYESVREKITLRRLLLPESG